MVTYQQLKATKPETLQGQIDGWGGVVTTAGSLKTSATSNVKDKVKYGAWQGRSGSDAVARCNYLEAELGAAKTEAEAVKKVLEWGKGQIAHVKGELDKQVLAVGKDPRLKINDQGVVEIQADKLGGAQSGPPTVLAAIEAQKEADKYNKLIKAILDTATRVDGQFSGALKAVANLDNPNDAKSPRFNADADKDSRSCSQEGLKQKYNMPDGTPVIIFVNGLPVHVRQAESWEALAAYGSVGPGPAGAAIRIHNTATSEAERAFGPDTHNEQGDAMKHALGSALLAQELGENTARRVTDGHEKLPGNPRDEEAMDLHNNDVGYQIARDNPRASKDELARLVEQAVRDGKMLTTKDGALYYSDGRPIPP